jgi:hypothetical protein
LLLPASERKKIFEIQNAQLKEVFSRYPDPGEMDGCSHCVDPSGKLALTPDNLEKYLHKAMTTWGSEEDFKHYLPFLFSYVFVEKKTDYDDGLICKLDYLKNDWTGEEQKAIILWFTAFSQYYLLNEFLEVQASNRKKVQEWLEIQIDILDCVFPFHVYSDFFGYGLLYFFDPGMFNDTHDPLELWPNSEADYLALASLAADYHFFKHDPNGKMHYGVFNPDCVQNWISKSRIHMEKLFWKASDTAIQQLLSDGIVALECYEIKNSV